MSGSTSGSGVRRGGQWEPDRDEGITDQARSAMRDVADRASEVWDDAYNRGERFYRQGSRAVGELDSTTMAGFLVAAAAGFALGWLMFSPQFRSANDMTRRMSEASDRYRDNRARRQ
jgi:hypothetical protein